MLVFQSLCLDCERLREWINITCAINSLTVPTYKIFQFKPVLDNNNGDLKNHRYLMCEEHIAVFPNLLEFGEHQILKLQYFEEKSNFYPLIYIFEGRTWWILWWHYWSPEQWLSTTALVLTALSWFRPQDLKAVELSITYPIQM